MTVNSAQVVPSGESLAAPVGVALSDFAPSSLSVASGELRAKLITDATAAFSTLSGDQALKVQSLLDTAQLAFTAASEFESTGTEHIRTLSALDATLSKVTDSMMQVGSACRQVAETVLPTLDGAHVEKVSALLQTLSAQAEDFSSSIDDSKSVWREQVFAREVHDKRVAKVDALAATT
ncbi:MAG: hypothetical protein J0M12_11535, partial [Deltaproteobacteria bacterium]|nr:hypothetical protein [Deltaproteobacteria bacterium]